MEQKQRSRKLGLTGLLLGLLALGVAVWHFFEGPIAQPPTMEESVADTAIRIKAALEAKVRGEEYQAPATDSRIDPDEIVRQGVIVAAILAIALGVFGFVLREEWRASGAAFVLGVVTIAFQFLATAVMMIVAAIVIAVIAAAIIGALGLS